jgi:hypothetical protein
MAPEWVLAWAMQQWIIANRISKEGGTSIRFRYAVCVLRLDIGKGWTRKHGFFIIMGGFHAYTRDDSKDKKLDPGTPCYPLDQETVFEKYRKGEIEWPLEGEIQDRSKTDWLAKTLVLCQTGWFIIQCIARGVAHLPLSELEVITLAYTIMNVGIFIAWWDKPRDVDRPIRVFLSPDEVGKERDDGSSIKDIIIRMLWDLLPGVHDVDLSAHSSVPTFYPGKPNEGRDLLPSWYVASAVGFVFGAIHFIAWSYSFPSHTEQLLWQLSSVVIVGVPACVAVVSAALTLLVWLDDLSLIDTSSTLIQVVFPPFFLVGVVICSSLYGFARATTFVLASRALSSLPVAAFQTIPWTKWIPHV